MLVGAIAFVAGTVGVRYVKKLIVPAPTAAPEDDRVKKLLSQRYKYLAR